MAFGVGAHSCLGRNVVTGMMNKGDENFGAHGTAVRILLALYGIGAELDPQHPPVRPHGSLHDPYESVPIILQPVCKAAMKVLRCASPAPSTDAVARCRGPGSIGPGFFRHPMSSQVNPSCHLAVRSALQ